MHKIIFLAFLIHFFTSCDNVENLEYYCNNKTACWLPPGTENNQNNIIFNFDSEKYKGRGGFCGAGHLVCEEDNARCEGVKYPEKEECDGIDNDCNGIIDDPQYFYAGAYNTKCYFEEIGACKFSEQHCINGELVCSYNTSWAYGQEVCDNIDNDCDGEYDEDIPQEFIYNGPPETVNIGNCRAGVTDCVNGNTVIRGMITPVAEICSNNIDDDCDGLVDEGESNLEEVDFALLVDFSGSMLGQRIRGVISSICYSPHNISLSYNRYAIIAVSTAGGSDPGFELDLITDFTDLNTACELLQQRANIMHINITSGRENQIDAILRTFQESPVALNWLNNTKKIYVFSDEEPQSEPYHEIFQRFEQLNDECLTYDYKIGVFTDFMYYTDWNLINSECLAFIDNIDYLQNPQYLSQNFLTWYSQRC